MTERQRVARRLRRRMLIVGNLVNFAGALLVGLYLLVIFPPEGTPSFMTIPVAIAMAETYCLLAGISASYWALRRGRPVWDWLQASGPPSPRIRRAALKLPARIARITLLHWLLAIPVFFPLTLVEFGTAFAFEAATTIALSGLTVGAAVFLSMERVARPALAYALDDRSVEGVRSLGVGPRLLLAWVLCSGVPIVMLMLIPIGRDVDDPSELRGPTIFVAVTALVAGLLATKLATASVTAPLRGLRRAVDAVGEGDVEVHVDVDDASEVGRLQAGFNAMVAGLRERERLRDLFTRQVGADVVAEALQRDPTLGGQVRTVSALFVDVEGSTGLAQREAPERVVERLNAFFAQVVRVVESHGGFVNKFEGDAALVLWNAPGSQHDHATCALRAARELRRCLDADPDSLPVGIGVSCGEAVAGWVGAESRFEYTAIGDPINEASRLTELAKDHPCRLLASGAAVDAAQPDEQRFWEIGRPVTLRGRDEPTRIAAPVAQTAQPPSTAAVAAG